MEIKIIQAPDEKNPFAVVYKNSGIPCAPLKDDDYSALNELLKIFPELKNVSGKKDIEYGLVHRIDNDTQGLFVVASNQDSYDFFLEQQKNNNFVKKYFAACEVKKNYFLENKGFEKFYDDLNFAENLEFEIKSRFRFFSEGSKEVRPVTKNSNPASLKKSCKTEYSTYVKILELKNNVAKIECRLTKGFRHQVRCHLAWCGLPILGDPIYNKNSSGNKFEFYANQLEFIHPLTKEKVCFKIEV